MSPALLFYVNQIKTRKEKYRPMCLMNQDVKILKKYYEMHSNNV